MKKDKIITKFCRTLVVSLAIAAFFSFSCLTFAQTSPPKQIDKEKKNFLENQISSADKLFLDQLGLNFQYLSEINGRTLEILNFLPSINELEHSPFVTAIRTKAKKIIPELTGRNKPGWNLKYFIKMHLGRKNTIESDFKRLLASYKEIKKINPSFRNNFTEDLPTAGIYRYYTLCSNSLECPLSEIFGRMAETYKGFAENAKKHEIGKLKRLLPEKILFLEKSCTALEGKLLDRLKYSQNSWGRNIILRIIRLAQQQIIFNKNFSASVLDKITTIATPNNPKLPDFQVVSIGITFTDMIKVGNEISLVVAVKNMGQLSAGSSKAKIIFPDNKAKVISVPKLRGGQTYLKTIKCKVCRAGRNEFKVIANYNLKTWESNTFNNVTKRALILP